MKRIIIIFSFLVISCILYSQDLTSDFNNVNYLPSIVKVKIFEKEILNNITDERDKKYILLFYYKDIANLYYYLKINQSKRGLLRVYNIMYSYKATHGFLALEKAKYQHENEQPAFSQKGGMLRTGDHSFYFRTDDEWTGFSTIFLGYRYAVSDYFNIATEGGAGLPQIYIASMILHFKIYESPKKLVFVGARCRFGYKFQNAESFLFGKNSNGEDTGYLGFGKNYLTIVNRHSFYFATDLTLALRFGRLRAQSIYYSIYPKFDFDLQGGQPYILFCPVMIGYEVRFGNKMEWSFAVEGGYSFPLPWGSIPDGKWINFPSLANVSVNYRFGDKFYWKKNTDDIYNEAMN